MARETRLAPHPHDHFTSLLEDKVQYIMATDYKVRRSFEKPTAVTGKAWFLDSLLVMWKGDIFLEGFARTRGASGLRQEQSWLEYSAESQKFEYRTQGGSARLLSHLADQEGSQIKLGRGLYPVQGQILMLYQKIRQGRALENRSETLELIRDILRGQRKFKADALGRMQKPNAPLVRKFERAEDSILAIRDAVKSSPEKLLDLEEKSRAALFGPRGLSFAANFTSPDLKRAKGWNKGAYLEATLETGTLKSLLATGEIYVGLEHGYVEIVFLTPRSVGAYVDALTFLKKMKTRD